MNSPEQDHNEELFDRRPSLNMNMLSVLPKTARIFLSLTNAGQAIKRGYIALALRTTGEVHW